MKPRKRKDLFRPDRLMQNIAKALIRDFQNADATTEYNDFAIAIQSGDIESIRLHTPVIDFHEPDPYRFKQRFQLHSIFKRYRFEKDLYSDDELEELEVQKFIKTQNRLRDVDYQNVGADALFVLRHARSYISDLLGVFCEHEHAQRCRFGKKASVGVPARDACLAARWEIPISGSSHQISWFHEVIRGNPFAETYLQRQLTESQAVKPDATIFQEIRALKLTHVPKTFKSMRAIMPNTTIGGYHSFGIGEMIRVRLNRAGYDIKRLQDRHKSLARKASITGKFVTADLSSASDSISTRLAEFLLPTDWFNEMNLHRIGTVTLPGNNPDIEMETFCTMGVGFTFSFQTLVFLSLLKGCEALLSFSRGYPHATISVYGDDMIYHHRMHQLVLRIFGEIGFVINIDKTFHEGRFRESCGGDYHSGVDVRPFQPRNGQAQVGKLTYEAMLYKYLNGLLRRWDEHEVQYAVRTILAEFAAIGTKVKIVPGDYPDDSGLKCVTLGCFSFLREVGTASVPSVGHGLHRFTFLRFTPERREENRHEPYYWARLDDRYGSADAFFADHGLRERHRSGVLRDVNYVTQVEDEVVELLETEELRPVQLIRSKLSGRRLPKTRTTRVVNLSGRYTRQISTSCFGVRS